MEGYSYIPNSNKAAHVGEKPARKNAIHQLEQTTTYPYLDTDNDITYAVMIEFVSALKTDVAIVMEAAMFLQNKSLPGIAFAYVAHQEDEEDPLITVKEAARILGKVERTLYNYVKKEILTAYRSQTGEIRFRLSEVRGFYGGERGRGK
jgi:predicted DNA-binding transcriptional regulator AlpA